MINKLGLHNFKSYKDELIEFAMLTVFCGNNSVGKSTAIQAISIPIQSYFKSTVALNGNLVELGSLKDIHHQNADDTSLNIELEINSGTISWGFIDIDTQENISNKHLTALTPFEITAELEYLTNNIQYLQAERYGPRVNYEIKKSDSFHKDWLGAKGEFTSEFLSQSAISRRLFVGGTDNSKDAQIDPRLHPDEEQASLNRQIDAWLKEISPGISVASQLFEEASTSVNIFEQNGNRNLKSQNVGFGVSYALSIVTALLFTRPGGLIIIENPEAHLHPRGQSYLGRLISLTAQAGVQVIIETHSDHLINGMRLMPRLGKVNCEKIKIYQVVADSTEKCSKVIPITVSPEGELSQWPTDFFDQQLIDMDILMSGKEPEKESGKK
ncbi:DUF3696 domain-containing protein [Providencia burhodogranariea]|uniref:DUF3696 domain-containing protein n=1 Tax=Providencia burhodogranariea DSM 19968 TaxID=1141662 RepID=K8WV61_9GAMM|nr:DUF3696 domain-containing protein [Providencia burhodogranariea]EKT64539.1 hypothetical protein OOA_02042 [Providencia burhodogranariea DSM 19968]